MRKFISISFLLLYIFGATEGYQLLKLPLLITHYYKHKQECPGFTVMSFLKVHYLEPQTFDDDYQQDMQLPFKTCDAHAAISPVVLPGPAWQPLDCIQAIEYQEYQVQDEIVPASSFQPPVFQPPRA